MIVFSENLVTEKDTKRKGRKSAPRKSEATTNTGHAECNSPHPCKKCRIMRRLGKFSNGLLHTNSEQNMAIRMKMFNSKNLRFKYSLSLSFD